MNFMSFEPFDDDSPIISTLFIIIILALQMGLETKVTEIMQQTFIYQG